MAESLPKKTFTLKEAQDLLPIVQKITQEAVEEAEDITSRMQDLDDEEDPDYEDLERSYADIVSVWAGKVLRLGCEVKGPWLVDFDNGHGYFCWQHPEEVLEYYHPYEEGFSGRTKIN
jgi:hypothetical protein